jgi:hypothetical protein
MSTTYGLRAKLIDIARRDVGQMETSRNQGPAMKKFWPATSYPEGYANREPYCAAGVCYWIQQWLQLPEVLAALKLTAAAAEKWRCKSAAAFGWLDWAEKKGILTLSDSIGNTLHTGDIMVFDMSHIGVVVTDSGSHVQTIEANTGATGGRDGDGVFEKFRERSLARRFIRLLP